MFFPEIKFKESETSSQAGGENPGEILKTLFTIVSGIPHNTEAGQGDSIKSRDPPVDVSEDDHQKYKYVLLFVQFYKNIRPNLS